MNEFGGVGENKLNEAAIIKAVEAAIKYLNYPF